MEKWTEESDATRQSLLELLLVAVGTLMMLLTRDVDFHVMNDLFAAFATGALLFIVGIVAFIENIHQTITIDPVKRLITIVTETRFKSTEKTIAFDYISDLRVAFLGRRSNVIGQTYYLSLTLSDGTTRPLFFPAYFKGRGSESVANERLGRLKVYLGRS